MSHRDFCALVTELGTQTEGRRGWRWQRQPDKELGFSRLGSWRDLPRGFSEATYPGTILKAANLLFRGVVRLGRDGHVGVPVKLFFCPQLRGPLQLTGTPRWRGTVRFHNSPPSPQCPQRPRKEEALRGLPLGSGRPEAQAGGGRG